MHRRELAQLGKALTFIGPWLVGFCVCTALPVALSFYYSLCSYSLLKDAKFIGIENYRELVADSRFWVSIYNTLRYAVMALPAGLVVSLGLAMLLNVSMPGRALWRTIIFLPSLVPVVASAMLWMWLFNPKVGLINIALAMAGIEGPVWLNSGWAMPALAFMSLWGVGHSVVIYLAGLQDVPVELYEAAELDGAGALRRMWHVTLPTLSPVIFFNLIMAIIGTLQVFDVPYIMTSGGPGTSTYFLSMYLYDNAFMYARMGYASALAWMLTLLVLALTGLAFWSSRRWVHYQGK